MLERSVAAVNREIDEALKEDVPAVREQRLAELHAPHALEQEVFARFNDAFTEILDVEFAVRGSWARETYPDQIPAYRTLDWIYTYSHAWLDPRRVVLVWQASTIKAYGVYFGTDKLSHFHHMGQYYLGLYRDEIARGTSEDDAVAKVIWTYSEHSPIAENALLGYVATGVYSNGDLAANYMGFKFYRNITEPVRLKGVERPPLVVRVGNYWALNKHVRPESGWFGWFISDHWNEALNPSLYGVTIRSDVRDVLAERADSIYAFWTTVDHRPADPSYYSTLASQLTTYYGEPYGHSGEGDEILSISNTVFPAHERLAAARRAGRGQASAGVMSP